MRLYKTVLIASFATFLSGCTNQPLLFSSGVTVGVDIGINGTSSNPINLTVGYKQLDATLVPVTAIGKDGDTSPIRGCSNSATEAQRLTPCTPPGNDATPNGNGRPTNMSDGQPGNTPVQIIPAVALSPTPRADGTFGTQAQASNDALSVYSSFDAKVDTEAGASAAAGVGIGKVFATGVAAQNLTDGQRLALIYQAQGPAACVQNLANALNAGAKSGSISDAMVQVCARPAPQNQ